MLRKILTTIGTRYLVAILNLALIFINAKELGIEGVGLVGVLVASVNIAVIFNGILCGNTLIYFMNRYSLRRIIVPAYVWTLAGSGLACGFMLVTTLLPTAYWKEIYGLAILTTLANANARFLLGKERIKAFNLTQALQGGLLFFVLVYLYFVARRPTVGSYIAGLYVANGIACLYSFYRLIPLVIHERKACPAIRLPRLLREMFAYGLWAGADNLAETFTTRLNYFLIQRFGGLGGVGLLDAGTRISESVWHISRSVSFIEYEEVAKEPSKERQAAITIRLLKLTALALTLAVSVIALIPEWIFTEILFSREFEGIRHIIWGLSAGIIALGCNSVVSHYFIGSGQVRYSTFSSCVGLATLALSGYWLIPRLGTLGSALSTSVAFCAMLAYSLLVFIRKNQVPLKAFLPNRDDWRAIRRR